jgi:hypothetical protein
LVDARIGGVDTIDSVVTARKLRIDAVDLLNVFWVEGRPPCLDYSSGSPC